MFSRPYRRASLCAAIVVALVFAGEFSGIFDSLERRFLDLRYAWFNQNLPVSDEVVFVEFDDASIDALAPEIGGWPWPRGTVVAALMLDYIMIGKPAILLFDELYATYSPKAPGTDIPEEDWLMLEASMAYPNVSHQVLFQNRGISEPVEMFEAAIANFAIDVRGTPLDFPAYDAYRAPYEPLRDYASLLHAAVDVGQSDRDAGAPQHATLLVRYDSTYFPTLATRAVDAFHRPRSYTLDERSLVLELAGGASKTIPLLPNGDYLLNRYPADADFESYTAFEIVESSRSYFTGGEGSPVAVESFRDKIVILGSRESVGDLTAVSNILEDHHLRPLPRWLTLLLVAVVVSAVVGATFFLRRGAFIVGPLVIVAVLAVGVLSFRWAGVVVDMTALLCASVLSLAGAAAFRRVAKSGAPLHPSTGPTRELTVLSCRLRGVGELGEALPPERVGELVDGYAETMLAAIHETAGTIEVLAGDSLSAVWEDAASAVGAALRIAREIDERGVPAERALGLAIGIHTGTVIVATIEKAGRTFAVGQNVDIGGRIRELTSRYRVKILTTGETHAKTGDAIVAAFLDTVMIAGQSLVLYAPLAERSESGERADRIDAAVEGFAQARAAYDRRDFEAARAVFTEMAEEEDTPLAGPASVFATRCDRFIKTPPPEGWSGIWRTG